MKRKKLKIIVSLVFVVAAIHCIGSGYQIMGYTQGYINGTQVGNGDNLTMIATIANEFPELVDKEKMQKIIKIVIDSYEESKSNHIRSKNILVSRIQDIIDFKYDRPERAKEELLLKLDKGN